MRLHMLSRDHDSTPSIVKRFGDQIEIDSGGTCGVMDAQPTAQGIWHVTLFNFSWDVLPDAYFRTAQAIGAKVCSVCTRLTGHGTYVVVGISPTPGEGRLNR